MTANSDNEALRRREARLGALFEAALMGDAGAYRTFLTEASGHVRAFVKRRSRDASDVEDVVQEVLLAVHDKRHTFDHARPVTSWLYAIARYKLIDHLRRRRHDFRLEPLDDDVADDLASAEPDGNTLSARRDLARLLDTLPDRQRLPIVHVKLEGLSVAETSRLTGISESAVKVGIHRGLKALAARLRETP